MKKSGFTLTEVVIVMLVIAVVAGISIRISKSRTDKIISTSYYSTYSVLSDVTALMLGDYRATNTYTDKADYTPPEGADVTISSCDEGKIYSISEDKCVNNPITIPRKAVNFCKHFASYVNTSAEDCTGDSISSTDTDFSSKTPDIVMRNGIKLFNLSAAEPDEISDLAGNTSGASYIEIVNTNAAGYIIYADIDGGHGNSVLWEDVYPFYITMSGLVIPAYSSSEEAGANSKFHLEVSVLDENPEGKNWIVKSVPFQEGACKQGYVGEDTSYCGSNNQHNDCKTDGHDCQLKILRPFKFL